jgi:hypothetical protein
VAALKELNVGVYAKAVVAAVATGSATALTLMGDGKLSVQEMVMVLMAVLGSAGVTYAVPNDKKAGQE